MECRQKIYCSTCFFCIHKKSNLCSKNHWQINFNSIFIVIFILTKGKIYIFLAGWERYCIVYICRLNFICETMIHKKVEFVLKLVSSESEKWVKPVTFIFHMNSWLHYNDSVLISVRWCHHGFIVTQSRWFYYGDYFIITP